MSVYDLYPNHHEFDIKLDLKRALVSILTYQDAGGHKSHLARVKAVWVLKQRFWHNKTLKEVGEELGVSQERVRQYEAKGLRLLRHPRHGLRPM